jgi:hypothetical protein
MTAEELKSFRASSDEDQLDFVREVGGIIIEPARISSKSLKAYKVVINNRGTGEFPACRGLIFPIGELRAVVTAAEVVALRQVVATYKLPVTLQFEDELLLDVVESASRPGVYHEIRWSGGKVFIYCTCESWEFHQVPCRHMKDWAKDYGPVDLNSPIGEQLRKILLGES